MHLRVCNCRGGITNMKRAKTKAILLFVLFAFLPVWGGGAYMLFVHAPISDVIALFFVFCMFCPALASILTRLVLREGFRDMFLRPRFRTNALPYALAILVPPLVILLGAALYFIVYPARFDGVNASFFAQLAQGVLLAPILNLIPCLGEELGWRGYLLQKLNALMPKRCAALVSGAIWGIWHAPMIALGHNYGYGYAGYPWVGILLMTLFCMGFGCFLAAITQKTKSALPAALAHASLNGVAAIGLLALVGEPDVLMGPLITGILSMTPTLVLGAACLLRIGKKGM